MDDNATQDQKQDELLVLKESLKNFPDNGDDAISTLYSQVRKCLEGKLQVLLASGLLSTNNLDEILDNLDECCAGGFHERERVLHSIDLCLERIETFREMREVVPV